MRVAIAGAGRAVDQSRLDELETTIGRPLPPSYRAFLLRNNGGEPDLDHYPITGMTDNPFGEIRMFLGIDAAAEHDDVEATLDLLKDSLPQGFLPVGYSSGGDMICVSLNDHDHGAVYFWDSQAESEPAPWMRSGYSNAYFVADSFEHFIASLDKFEAFAG